MHRTAKKNIYFCNFSAIFIVYLLYSSYIYDIQNSPTNVFMAQSKTDLFAVDEIRLATLAKALAHPARVAILKILAERNECMCGEIVEVLPLAQATVSQHLRELKDAGFITGEVDGPKVCYCLNAKVVREWKRLIQSFDTTLECCKPAAKK
jgi:ArsR family transcriptional regulator, arsenate/arsenite/antimonite-responsive transcriptional repressor